jgi:hypothetical protein
MDLGIDGWCVSAQPKAEAAEAALMPVTTGA